MWKIFFSYSDGGSLTVTGKGKEATPEQLVKYSNQYGNADSAVYQKYPKKDNQSIKLW